MSWNAAVPMYALCGIYHDFCDVAWEESVEPEYASWASTLGINHIRLGQVIGDRSEWASISDEDLLTAALPTLVENERERVAAALIESYGSVSDLFLGLWRSKDLEPTNANTLPQPSGQLSFLDLGGAIEAADTDEAGDHEDEWEILNDVTDDKMAAFESIDAGCPTRLGSSDW